MAADRASPTLKAKYNDLLEKFLADEDTTDLDDLESVLVGHHQKEAVNLNYQNEVEERLRIVRLLDERLAMLATITAAQGPKYEMTPEIAAFFMLLPMTSLKALENKGLLPLLQHVQRLKGNIHLFKRGYDNINSKQSPKTQSTVPSAPAPGPVASASSGASQLAVSGKGKRKALSSSGVSQGSGPSGSKQTAAQDRRNDDEKGICMARDDGRCVITNSSAIEICHIVPYAMYNTTERRLRVQNSVTELFDYFGNTLELTRLVYNEPTLDKNWNLVCLDRTVHKAWGDAKSAFECLGISPDPNTDNYFVTLKFHWLNVRQPTKPADFKLSLATLSSMVSSYPETLGEGSYLLRQDRTRVKTGHIFKITMPNREDAERMMALFNAQWLVLRLAAMSGAAVDFRLSFSDIQRDSEHSALREMVEAGQNDGPSGRSMEDVEAWASSLS